MTATLFQMLLLLWELSIGLLVTSPETGDTTVIEVSALDHSVQLVAASLLSRISQLSWKFQYCIHQH